jgi:Dolichyl-phosphate-mannose-protein mannosyltransferase
MLASWQIGRRLQDARAGLFAAGLYVVCPFALFHDRMVLADVFLSTAAALTLLATVALAERPSRRRGVLVGLAMAACVLSKIPGLLAFAIPGFGAAFLPRRAGTARALVAAYAVATALSIGPVVYFFQHSAQVQEQAALSDEDEARSAVVGANLQTVAGWLWAYWTPGVCGLALVAFAAAVVRRDGPGLLLGSSAVLPITAFALFSRSWFPRYVFLSTIPCLVLVAIALSRFVAEVGDLARRRGPWLPMATVALVGWAVLWPAVQFDLPLLTDPASAPFPEVDRFQYVEGWTAGYGRTETARRLLLEAERNPAGIVVGVGGAEKHGWRPLYLLLRAALLSEDRAEIEVVGTGGAVAQEAILGRAGGRAAFLAVSLDGESNLPTGTPVLQEARANGTLATALYRLLPADGAAR